MHISQCCSLMHDIAFTLNFITLYKSFEDHFPIVVNPWSTFTIDLNPFSQKVWVFNFGWTLIDGWQKSSTNSELFRKKSRLKKDFFTPKFNLLQPLLLLKNLHWRLKLWQSLSLEPMKYFENSWYCYLWKFNSTFFHIGPHLAELDRDFNVILL